MAKIKMDANKISLLALFPIIMTILRPYTVTQGGGLYLCDIFIVLIAGYFVMTKKFVLYTPLICLLGIDFVLTILAFSVTNSNNTSLFMAMKVMLIFMIYLLAYSNVWKLELKASFFKYAEFIGLLCAGLAILQFIFGSIGIEFYDGRLFLPLGESNFFGGLFDRNTNNLRVHSFFEEPSYLAFFEIPITAHLVQEKKYLKAVICGLSCILSGSLIGLLGLSISLCAILLLDSDFEKRQKIRLFGLILIAVAAAVSVYYTNDSFKTLIDYFITRGLNVEASSQRTNSSFYQRIIGNSALFSKYNTINKLIGVGFNQYFLYFGIVMSYSNDFVCNLLDFGLIGIVAMLITLVVILKSTSSHGRIFALIFIILLAVDHVWFGPMFFYMMTWIMMKSDTLKASTWIRLKI